MKTFLTLLLLFIGLPFTGHAQETYFVKGADVGFLQGQERRGVVFHDRNGRERECLELLKNDYQISGIRMRVWVNPRGGDCDKNELLAMAKRVKALGMDLMVNFHYSDTWADPKQQGIPAAWKGHSFTQMKRDLREHTIDVLTLLKQNGITPRWVQVGNETANGMLWPMGHIEKNPKQYAGFIGAAYDAVKEVFPESTVIIHLDRGHKQSLYDWNLDIVKKYGGKWDMIGMSLYPYWARKDHPELDADSIITDCMRNIRYCSKKYGCDVMIVETGFEVDEQHPELMEEGRRQLTRIVREAQTETDGHCRGVFYWEPQCLPGGYKLGAFNSKAAPTAIMEGFVEAPMVKTIDEGGSGMFKAIAVKEAGAEDFVVYRPKDLAHAHARQGKLPLLMWANGGCMDTSAGYERMLTEIASHGYIVMAIGEMEAYLDSRKQSPTESSELKRGLDWMLCQNTLKSSAYYQYIDTTRIAAAGHSCGGAQALWNAADPRLKTLMIMNAGMGDMEMAGASRASLSKVHTPILYVTGGESDVAYGNAKKDFERIGHVPVAWANHPASGHGGTYKEKYGGDYARLVIDWLDWQLKGKKDCAETFIGGEAKGYSGWTIQTKHFVDFKNVKPLWIQNGDRQIYGELFTPLTYREGLGEGRPIAIVAHGFNGTYHYGRNYFDVMQKLGYQCYAFDFPCGSVNSRSDNNTLNMSILDEQSDLRAIVNYFHSQGHQHIVLIGESQGGLVSALTAAQMKDKISQLVLVFPALCIPENWRARYPKLSDIPEVTELWGVKMGRRFFEEIHNMNTFKVIGKYRGPVLIVQGDKDQVVLIEDSKRAQKLYKDAHLHIIPGAGHGFKPKEFQEEAEQLEKFLK